MIEKMQFVNITGPQDDIDRAIERYISNYDIQLENALIELKTARNLYPYTDINPYKEVFTSSKDLRDIMGLKDDDICRLSHADITPAEASDIIKGIATEVADLQKQKAEREEKLAYYMDRLTTIEQFIGLDYDVKKILDFKFIQFRFGKFPKGYYEKFMEYVYDTVDSIFYKAKEDNDYVWGVYFVPENISERIDAMYTSMHFERFYLPDYYKGTPKEAADIASQKVDAVKADIKEIEAKIKAVIEAKKEDFFIAVEELYTYNRNFEIRKLAAKTKNKQNTFYILCGWITAENAAKLKAEIDKDSNTYCIIEDNHGNLMSKPPTKLKNSFLFKPFEMFVEMYGMPDYKEVDPTVLIGITYSILFGFMFGDVGQGALLLLLGSLIAVWKKSRLAAIIARCGFFSVIFGFLFGSIFGFENILPALWLHPATVMSNIPKVGNINTVFVVAIILGMGLVIFTMILSIINKLRFKEVGESLFDTNGVAGLVFYASAFAIILLFINGKALPAGILLFVMFILPLIIIFLKEPLTHIIEKKAHILPEEKGMFVVQGIFELFEILLSYFSNTLSFVRVGAFAVSHAAMMQVVMMLAGAEHGNPNLAVVIFGNLFVMGMEGLIVGIQVLRLEYYELFSRFYSGTGRAFVPYNKK